MCTVGPGLLPMEMTHRLGAVCGSLLLPSSTELGKDKGQNANFETENVVYSHAIVKLQNSKLNHGKSGTAYQLTRKLHYTTKCYKNSSPQF